MSGDAAKKAIMGTKESKKEGNLVLNKEEAIAQGLEMVKKLPICMVGTNGEDGFPNIKTMFNLKHEGFKRFWFSTNTSSRRVKQLRKDNRVCVYFVDEKLFKGLKFTGTMEVLQDIESKKILWNEKSGKYYQLGIEDPDYSVLCFTAKQGNYYHALTNMDFEIE